MENPELDTIVFILLFLGMAVIWSLVFGLPTFLLVFGSPVLISFFWRFGQRKRSR